MSQSTTTTPRSFIELYNKFHQVYERLTNGRRDMKNFYDLLHAMQSTEERYYKDIDACLKKQQAPILANSLTNMYTEVKTLFGASSKLHQNVFLATYKDLCQQLDLIIKEIKVTKTKLLDSYTKLVKDVEAKKAAHAKAKKTYEDSVDKAESAVANFRSGRSQVGNDKQVKKLEEAMHSASKELEKNHSAYLQAVRACQTAQIKYEEETEVLLIQFQDLENKRCATYQAVMNRFVDIQNQHKMELTQWYESLNSTFQAVNPPQDILQFILDTYDGKPLEPHVFYEPKNSDVIPHYGDIGASHESQEHLNKVQVNHTRLMTNSSQKPHTYNIQSGAGSAAPAASNPSFQQPAVFSPGQAGTGVGSEVPSQADQPKPAAAAVKLQCTALYDFVGQEQGDLSFTTGQTIDLVQSDAAEDWWFGAIGPVSGAFPKTYVSPPFPAVDAAAAPAAATPAAATPAAAAAAPADHPPIMKVVTALYDFDPENPDELKLVANEKYCVFSVIEDWYEGAQYKDGVVGARGIFPQSFTQ